MIKLKIVIGSTDEKYVNRLADYISLYYSDKIELYSFTQNDVLIDFLQMNRMNGVFVESELSTVKAHLSSGTAFALLVDGWEMESDKNMPVLMKYQSAETLIKEMLSLCSEQVSQIRVRQRSDGTGQVYLFESPAGGVGTTTLACACAIYLYHHGQKVLYLNLENFGTMSSFLSGEGRADLGDLIYALKAKRGNFDLKLESVVRQDLSGISYIEPCRHAADTESICAEDMRLLIRSVVECNVYDTVILDRNSGVADTDYELRKYASQVILISDGSQTANRKVQKLYEALLLYEKNEDLLLMSKVKLLYNRFGSRTGCRLELDQMETLGGFPRFENMEERTIIEQMAEKEVFGSLFQGVN